MFDKDWTKGVSSKEYLSAESFEEWLKKKYHIKEEDFEEFPYDTKDFYRDEYSRDMDYAGFVSAYREPFVQDSEYDVSGEQHSRQDSGQSMVKGICMGVFTVMLCAAAAFLFVSVFPLNSFDGIREDLHDRFFGSETDSLPSQFSEPDTDAEYSYAKPDTEYPYESMEEQDNRKEQDDGSTSVSDTVRYEHLVPGKEYTITGTLIDKNTGEPVKDENGDDVESSKTFVPESSGGEVDLSFELDPDNEAKEIVVQENIDSTDSTVHCP